MFICIPHTKLLQQTIYEKGSLFLGSILLYYFFYSYILISQLLGITLGIEKRNSEVFCFHLVYRAYSPFQKYLAAGPLAILNWVFTRETIYLRKKLVWSVIFHRIFLVESNFNLFIFSLLVFPVNKLLGNPFDFH